MARDQVRSGKASPPGSTISQSRKDEAQIFANSRAAHDALLFELAYPASPIVRMDADLKLKRFAASRAGRPADDEYDNTGIAHSAVRTTFSIDLIRWLCRRGARRVVIDWGNEDAAAALDRLLPLICCRAEIDGILCDRRTTREWMSHAARRHASDLAWIIENLDRAAVPRAWQDDWFESLGLPVRWNLAGDSRTTTRFPPRPIFYTPDGLLKKADLPAILESPLPQAAKLGKAASERLIDTARSVLAARGRETDPVTYADARDASLFRLDRGIDVALFGMTPDRRLPIESYVGFVAARNRVPIAYGGSWIFGGRCEIGVNLFEEFRGGESAQIFGQVMRAYRQHFDAAQFLVDPFQFGADNEEAIRSGAFWFYYRLGFRPVDPAIRRIAEREAARLQSDPVARTSPRMFRRFATGKIYLDVSALGAASGRFLPAAPSLEAVGLALSDWIVDRFRSDRAKADRVCGGWVGDQLGSRGLMQGSHSRIPDPAITTLAPLFAMLNSRRRFEDTHWPHIACILKAKAGGTERNYVKAWQRALPTMRRQFDGF